MNLHRSSFFLNIRYRSVFLFSILCLLVVFTVSCDQTDSHSKNPLAYQDTAFSATVHGELAGLAFKATVEHSTASESTTDRLTTTFTSPDALSGIVIHRQEDHVSLALNNMQIDASTWQDGALLELAHLFALRGTLLSVTEEYEHGEIAAVLTEDSGKAYTVTVSAQSGFPCRIEGDGIWLEILTFETTKTGAEPRNP